MSNTIIMNETNTSILAADGTVISSPVDVNLKDAAEFIAEGSTTQFTAYNVDGKRTRQAFVNEFGTNLAGITSMEAALKLSGLNFEAKKVPTYDMTKEPGKPPRWSVVKGQYNVKRVDTNEIIGLGVGERYQVLQNIEAFQFLDNIAEQGGEFISATMYRGSRIMICMKTPNIDILGDAYAPYILFLNSFDGTLPLQAMYTPTRIFCANCVNRAIKGATNRTTIRHTTNMVPRLEATQQVMKDNISYMRAFKAEAEKLAIMPVSENQFYDFLKKEYPVSDDAREVMNMRNIETIDRIMACYSQDDLENFNGTAYKIIQAVSDYESRKPSVRTLKNPELRNFQVIVEDGMPLLNKVWNYVTSVA